MAAGSAESYVRLWSLKGEKLRGMRSDFQASAIKDGANKCLGLSRCAFLLTLLIMQSVPFAE